MESKILIKDINDSTRANLDTGGSLRNSRGTRSNCYVRGNFCAGI
jgi:hypothetical protein